MKPDSELLLNEISAAFEEYVHAKSEHESLISKINAVDAMNDVFTLVVSKIDTKRGIDFQVAMIDLAQTINNLISSLLIEIRTEMSDEE